MNKIRTIYPNKKRVYMESSIFIIVLVVSFIPGINDIFKNYVVLGIPMNIALPFVAIIGVIYFLYKIVAMNKVSPIEIYEDKVVIGTFESSRENLIVKVKSGGYSFISNNETKNFNYPITKEDTQFLSTL